MEFSSGMTGVVWKALKNRNSIARPFVVVPQHDDLRRLCIRYAQLRPDLSPLSSWAHLITEELFGQISSLSIEPNGEDFVAAWAGLVVAEAMLTSERHFSAINLSTCLATSTFAVARTHALWPDISESISLRRLDVAKSLCGGALLPERHALKQAQVRDAFQPIWSALINLHEISHGKDPSDNDFIAKSLLILTAARQSKGDDEAKAFGKSLLAFVPEAGELARLSQMPPETRLNFFDHLIERLSAATREDRQPEAACLSLIAGYLATVAAGGEPTLSLAEEVSEQFPTVLAWAYAIGGLGENVVWTSSFDGLGRLVARELQRPFRLDEPPSSDLSLDEAVCLVDNKLSDPYIYLKLKRSVANISILPGVNVSVPTSFGQPKIVEKQPRLLSETTVQPINNQRNDLASILIDAMWPQLQSKIEQLVHSTVQAQQASKPPTKSQKSKARQTSSEQPRFPT